ncbi:hypothetical protein AKJ58_00420 [candidate division MSBL1 archaeon SCGC-AAA385D11]|uniref:Zinc-ribbon domain-containing protein n=1 Tax=candidate division MSBL1 archaeon SCGC-AAA385D11 TaxID=1698286 RepID=A0A133VPB3_9EURY|nr:hypothetical protein AKJ58_00420 [candidate division MSBL1 archaeon SCGC-AAA385D11]
MPFCPECGTEVDGSANFCPNCGTGLEAKTSTPSIRKEEFKSAELDEMVEEIANELRDKGVIGPDEKILAYSRQSRYKSLIKPASLIVTEKQLVYYNPKIIGSEIKTRTTDEIHDIAIDAGIKNATITIRTEAMDDLVFENFPKNECNKVRNTIRRIAESF